MTSTAVPGRRRRRIHVVPVLVVVFCASYFFIPLIAIPSTKYR